MNDIKINLAEANETIKEIHRKLKKAIDADEVGALEYCDLRNLCQLARHFIEQAEKISLGLDS